MKATFIFVFIFLSIFYVRQLSALDNSIVINEFLPDAIGTDSGKEYVELYNSTSDDINLKDWYFVNTSQTGSTKKIIFPDFNIKSKSYFVVAEDLLALSIQNGISIGSGKLALFNDFGKLQLLNSNNVLVAEVNYGDSKEGVSWDLDGPICNQLYFSILNTPGVQNSNYKAECFTSQPPISFPQKEIISIDKIEVSLDNNVWTDTISTYINAPIYFRYKLSKDIVPTSVLYKDNVGNILQNPFSFSSEYKGAISVEVGYQDQVLKANSLDIDIHSNVSTNTIITELYPSPESPDMEWIEIYNNDKQDINLIDYYIEEKTTSGITSTRRQLKDQLVKPGEYHVLYEDQFNVSLNNSGDTIYLFDKYGNQINKFIYSETDKSKSIGRKLIDSNFSDETFETLTPTPLSQNIFPISDGALQDAIPTYSLQDLPSLVSGTEFYTTLTIDNYIDKYIFISDGSIKYKSKLTKKIDEDLANTLVTLKAKVFTLNGIKNLLIDPDSIVVLDFLNPSYQEVDISTVSQSNIGDKVMVKGVVTEIYSNRIKIDVNGNVINIYTNDSFGRDLIKGANITVYGTLDYYRSTFRIVMSSYAVPQVNGDSTTQVSLPISYALKSNGTLVAQDYAKDSSNLYLVVLSIIIIAFVLLLEAFKNRKMIVRFVKQRLSSKINIFNRPVIKY